MSSKIHKTMLLDDSTYYFQMNAKKEADFQKAHRALHMPGVPGEADGFYQHAKVVLKKVRNPNIGRFAHLERDKIRYGWLDSENNVWVPSGPGRHGELVSWHVESLDGSRTLVFPGKKKQVWETAQEQEYIIECERIVMRCPKDEEAFFEWIKRISCFERITGSGYMLRFVLATYDLDEQYVMDIYALFRRYTIDLTLLKDFLSKGKNRKLARLIS